MSGRMDQGFVSRPQCLEGREGLGSDCEPWSVSEALEKSSSQGSVGRAADPRDSVGLTDWVMRRGERGPRPWGRVRLGHTHPPPHRLLRLFGRRCGGGLVVLEVFIVVGGCVLGDVWSLRFCFRMFRFYFIFLFFVFG